MLLPSRRWVLRSIRYLQHWVRQLPRRNVLPVRQTQYGTLGWTNGDHCTKRHSSAHNIGAEYRPDGFHRIERNSRTNGIIIVVRAQLIDLVDGSLHDAREDVVRGHGLVA